MHTEIINTGDNREALFDDAKRHELLGLLEKGAFRIRLHVDAGPNSNTVPTRFVLAIKHSAAEDKSPPVF